MFIKKAFKFAVLFVSIMGVFSCFESAIDANQESKDLDNSGKGEVKFCLQNVSAENKNILFSDASEDKTPNKMIIEYHRQGSTIQKQILTEFQPDQYLQDNQGVGQDLG